MNPLFNAATIIAAASSKRSRDSSMVWLNAANSRRANPRPTPNRSRPPDNMSATIAFSATRNGLFHGRITAAVPISIFGHSAARCAITCKLSGQNE